MKSQNFPSNQNSVDSVVQAEKAREIDLGEEGQIHILLSEGKIFVSFENGTVYCLDSKWDKKWVAEIFGNVSHNSVQYKDLFLAVTDAGDLYSINANNGETIQVLGTGETITTDLVLIDLIHSEYQTIGIVFGTADGNIFCYDIFSFELIWKLNISKNTLTAQPILVNDSNNIVFIDSNASLFCVSSKSGILIWHYVFSDSLSSGLNGYPISTSKDIISITPKDEIIAIDASLGKKIWTTKSIPFKPNTIISVFNSEIIYWDEKNSINFISAKSGKEINKLSLDNVEISENGFDSKDNIALICSSDNSVFKITRDRKIENILSPSDDLITTLKLISEDEFIIYTSSGKLISYKMIE